MRDTYLTSNYHAHTTRCLHALGTERDYIEAAIAAGITEFGFSDHVPYPFKDGHISPIRMRMDEAESYGKVIAALKEEYKGRINVYAGYEMEYYPEVFEEQMEMVRRSGMEYLILGQHFLGSELKSPYLARETKQESLLIEYVDTVIEGAKTGVFTYVAHPDILVYVGEEEIYDKHMRRLCQALKEMNLPLEINLHGLNLGKNYPIKKFWKIAGEVGNEVILGIDAHDLELIGDKEVYQKAMSWVEEFNLNLITKLTIDPTRLQA